jgi:hypothetical protein
VRRTLQRMKWSWLGVLLVGSMSGCDSGTTGNFFDEDLAVPRPIRTLTVTVLPDEGGTVTSTMVFLTLDGATSIECGQGKTTCALQIREGTSIQLTGTPAPTYQFDNWSGRGCFAATAVQSVTIEEDTACIISFTK